MIDLINTSSIFLLSIRYLCNYDMRVILCLKGFKCIFLESTFHTHNQSPQKTTGDHSPMASWHHTAPYQQITVARVSTHTPNFKE